MNRREWRYIRKLGYGIKGAIHRAALAGFIVDKVVVRPSDLKLLRKTSVTGNAIIAGVEVVDEHHGKKANDLEKSQFITITNAPDGWQEMMEDAGMRPGNLLDLGDDG